MKRCLITGAAAGIGRALADRFGRVGEGQFEVVRLLLAHGADPSLKDKDDDTAESFARQKGHSAVVELLGNPPPAERDKN